MAQPIIDVDLSGFIKKEVYANLHQSFLKAATCNDDPTWDFARLSGMYWTITALDLLDKLHETVNEDQVVEYVQGCHQADGGFSPAHQHDSHILSTLSAIQILSIYHQLHKIDADSVCKYVLSLQNSDGSFNGDKWGEVDTRFSLAAVTTLALLKKLHLIDSDLVSNYVMKCYNVDGGFGTRPWSESHAGQVFCCLGTLSVLHQLRRVNEDLSGWWLAERQLASGGLNGRPQKKPDVCYSWWVLSSLVMLGKLSWIDGDKLKTFILCSQDDETGGISDRPGNMADPYHTLFGLTGLSFLQETCTSPLMSASKEDSVLKPMQLKKINPVFCLPQEVIDSLGIQVQLLQ